jgi:adenosylmethionine-8-amino-7-oxononanoate aminotransferase
VFRRLLERGVIARALGDSIALCPAYVIELPDIDEVVRALCRAVDEIGAELRADR